MDKKETKKQRTTVRKKRKRKRKEKWKGPKTEKYLTRVVDYGAQQETEAKRGCSVRADHETETPENRNTDAEARRESEINTKQKHGGHGPEQKHGHTVKFGQHKWGGRTNILETKIITLRLYMGSEDLFGLELEFLSIWGWRIYFD